MQTDSPQLVLMYIGIGLILIAIVTIIIDNFLKMKLEKIVEVHRKSIHPLVGRDIQMNFGKKEFGVITRSFLQSEHSMTMVDKKGSPYPDSTTIFWAVFPAQNGEKHGCSRGLTRKSFKLV